MPAPHTLDDLRRERQKLFDRISWWEDHRHDALVPTVLLCFGAGYGLGWLLHLCFDLPQATGYLAAVGFVIVSGRMIDRAFAPRRLDAIDGQIARMERALKAAPPPTPTRAPSG